MRKLAIFCALLSLTTLTPYAKAEDECAQPVQETACVKVPLFNPGLPPVVGDRLKTYYIVFATEECTQSIISNACRGVPPAPGSTGSVFGVLYEESNGWSGLQRMKFAICCPSLVQADRMVLV